MLTNHKHDFIFISVKNNNQKYSIKVVENRTGLTHHVIRVWEKRYKAVIPKRTETNRRLYSDLDIERLRLLNKATKAGHKIGQIANYSLEELKSLIKEDELFLPSFQEAEKIQPSAYKKEVPIEDLLNNALTSTQNLDTSALESHLSLATIYHSTPIVLEKLIVPLLRKMGDLWRDGEFRIAHEHLASAVIRTVLGNMINTHEVPSNAPHILIGSPSGQFHELGALIVAATAVSAGWRVTFLGANIPAEEIAGVARLNPTKVVALSIIFPADDPRLVNELKKLRRFLPKGTKIIIGGRSAYSYKKTIDEINAILLSDMPSLMAVLEGIQAEMKS